MDSKSLNVMYRPSVNLTWHHFHTKWAEIRKHESILRATIKVKPNYKVDAETTLRNAPTLLDI